MMETISRQAAKTAKSFSNDLYHERNKQVSDFCSRSRSFFTTKSTKRFLAEDAEHVEIFLKILTPSVKGNVF